MLDLFQRIKSGTVELELEYIDVVLCFYDLAACLLVGMTDDVGETSGKRSLTSSFSIGVFPAVEVKFQHLVQCFGRIVFFRIQIEMQHRISQPILFKFLNGQPIEKFLFPEEVGFESGDEQALSETSRAAQEIRLSHRYEAIDDFRFIYIYIIIPSYLFETLYADRHLSDRCVHKPIPGTFVYGLYKDSIF